MVEQMTNKEFSNADIAERLGWKKLLGMSHNSTHVLGNHKVPAWEIIDAPYYIQDLPDFKNDLNACFKYGVAYKLPHEKYIEIMESAWTHRLPPEEIANDLSQAFMSMGGE